MFPATMLDPARLTSALADRYRIEREIGSGGMATVYLALDLKHDREVALKVLRPELAAVLGAERFLNEIKTTAKLQHPHILPLLDSGDADGLLFYAMPFVEGETLRARLAREHQLPIDGALRLAREVASALDYAHRHGVIHRDVKPENILLHDGSALVADFGIALAVSAAGGQRMTQTGLSLGTPQYMSPEQAMGERTIDARADIYALGAVTYEMLAGEPPFTGPSVQAIVARVITEQPRALSAQRRSVSQGAEAAVMRALEKLPADRFGSAREFAEALDASAPASTGARPKNTVAPETATRWRALALAAGAVAGLFAIWTGWLTLARRAGEGGPPSHYTIAMPPGEEVSWDHGIRVLLSADGSTFLYSRTGLSGIGGQLWIQRRNQLRGATIPGASAAVAAAISPAGDSVAVVTGTPGTLRVTAASGGTSKEVARDSVADYGLVWGSDGWLYFMNARGALVRVRTTGGAPEVLLRPDSLQHEQYIVPVQRPSAVNVVIVMIGHSGEEGETAAAFDLRSRAVTSLGASRCAWILSSGLLLSVRADGLVDVSPFDLRTLRPTGQPRATGVRVGFARDGTILAAMSETGTFLYVNGTQARPQHAVWVHRDGTTQVVDTAWAINPGSLSLSPDGSRLAVSLRDAPDIWVKTLDRGPLTRLSRIGGWTTRPAWAPDGRSLIFLRDTSALQASAVYSVHADGSGDPKPIMGARGNVGEATWSNDGRWLVFRTYGARGRNIFGLRPGVDSAPVPLLNSPAEKYSPSLSPDSRWLAYVSEESDRPEVYVRPFPNVGSARWQVSTSGGNEPLWSHDGRELYFRDGEGFLVAVSVAPASEFRVTARRALFPAKQYFAELNHAAYGVAPDGRFLFVEASQSEPRQIVLIDRWTEELQSLVAR